MVHTPRRTAKHGVSKGMAFADGHGREVDAVGHVADRINVGHRGLAEIIHRNGALPVQRNAQRFQAQSRGVGHTAQCAQHAVRGQDVAVVQLHLQRTLRAGNGLHFAAKTEL